MIELLESRRLLDDVPGPTKVAIGDTMYFAFDDGIFGKELWKSNLDGSNAQLVKDVYPGKPSSSPDWLFNFNGLLLFTAYNFGMGGDELWRSDGTEQGTAFVEDLYQGATSSYPHDFMLINDRTAFVAGPSGGSHRLFTTDGTTAGTMQLSNNLSTPGFIVVKDDVLYFEQSNQNFTQVNRWRTDGTVEALELSYGPLLVNRSLRVYGTDDDNAIRITARNGVVDVSGAGVPAESFAASKFSTIAVFGQHGNDSITIGHRLEQNATINGGYGDDTLVGGAGNDTISDPDGRDVMDGGAGNDRISDASDQYPWLPGTLNGGAGNDTISALLGPSYATGGDGDDSIETGDYPDYIDGGAGNDVLDGGFGPDTILGGAGNDTLTNSPDYEDSNDNMAGGPGNDSIRGGMGDDTLVGDEGIDTLDAGVGVDSIVSDADDLVIDAPAVIYGLPYYTTTLAISGTFGDDVVIVRPKLDAPGVSEVLYNGASYDFTTNFFLRIYGGGGDDRIVIDPALDKRSKISAGPGNDYIVGSNVQCTLFGDAGDDTLIGGAGDDYIDGGAGSDEMDGGAESAGGRDELNYSYTTDPLIKTTGEMIIRTRSGDADTYKNFEWLFCSDGDDDLFFDNPLDRFERIYGYDGDDRLTLVSHHQQPPGEIWAVVVAGGRGDDVISVTIASHREERPALCNGDNGNNTFVVSDVLTRHFFEGYGGTNTVDYSALASSAGISVTLDNQPNDGPSGGDNVLDEIKVVIGTSGDDTLVGSGGAADPVNTRAETLIGLAGNDSLVGLAGDDLLDGGRGADTLLGGDGDDTLVGGPGIDLLDGGGGANVIVDDVRLAPISASRLLDELSLL